MVNALTRDEVYRFLTGTHQCQKNIDVLESPRVNIDLTNPQIRNQAVKMIEQVALTFSHKGYQGRMYLDIARKLARANHSSDLEEVRANLQYFIDCVHMGK